MSKLTVGQQFLALEQDETVLDGLLRNGIDAKYGCKAGVCHSCIMIAEKGDIPPDAQGGLTEIEREMNCFLSCRCRPSNDLTIKTVEKNAITYQATIVEKKWLSKKVMRIRCYADMNFKAGQFVTIWNEHDVSRCYSIASTPGEGHIEFHIRYYEGGQFSPWFCNDTRIGDHVRLQGPKGAMFYRALPEQPLLLAATGTGLAAIYGVLKDALAQGHQGSIELVVGSQDNHFYLNDALLKLQNKHPQVKLTLLSESPTTPPALRGNIVQYCQKTFTELTNFRVYLCGDQQFVRLMRRNCFINGAAIGNISADSLLPFEV